MNQAELEKEMEVGGPLARQLVDAMKEDPERYFDEAGVVTEYLIPPSFYDRELLSSDLAGIGGRMGVVLWALTSIAAQAEQGK